MKRKTVKRECMCCGDKSTKKNPVDNYRVCRSCKAMKCPMDSMNKTTTT